jgi:hypothetical protein
MRLTMSSMRCSRNDVVLRPIDQAQAQPPEAGVAMTQWCLSFINRSTASAGGCCLQRHC